MFTKLKEKTSYRLEKMRIKHSDKRGCDKNVHLVVALRGMGQGWGEGEQERDEGKKRRDGKTSRKLRDSTFVSLSSEIQENKRRRELIDQSQPFKGKRN